MSRSQLERLRSALHERFSYKWLALSVTGLGALMASVNSSTLIIALPTLLRDLHTAD